MKFQTDGFITLAGASTRRYGLMMLALLPGSVSAGSARDYLSAPIDSWLAFYNTGYSRSVTPEDDLGITPSVRTNVVSQSVVITRTLDYWGRTGGFSLVLPHHYLNASADNFSKSNQGFGDAGILWQINLFGAPALNREQFRSFVPETFSSFHLFVGTPVGKYDAESAMNPGANRWTFSPTINYSYTPDSGWTWLETYLKTNLFTDNNDYRVGDANRLSQKPLWIIEGHASRNVTSELWLSADAYYNIGGETRIDGVAQDNAANTLRLGGGFGLRAWTGGDIIVNYERVVAKPGDQPEAQAIRLTLRQFW